MSAKMGFDQHQLLHTQWPHDCCLCKNEKEIERLNRVAKDMLFLAEGLADDDSWYGCRRQACKRTVQARKELGLPLTTDFDPDCEECGE